MTMTFGEQASLFLQSLGSSNLSVPEGIDVLNPYRLPNVLEYVHKFYGKFYSDNTRRIFLFGINPGRFGAGVTGIAFTDPMNLEIHCGIANSIDKKPELSSRFIYQLIKAYGGVKAFYASFYVTSVSPLGFIRDGKNLNYYDHPKLRQEIEPFMVQSIRRQIAFGTTRKCCLCLGQGENLREFQGLNDRYHFFDKIYPLPHPRFVLQYKKKQLAKYVKLYLHVLGRCEKLIR